MHKILNLTFFQLPLTERIGLVGIYSLFFFAWESKSKALIALLFVVLSCVADWRFWHSMRTSAVSRTVAVLLAYALVRGVAATLDRPELASYHLHDGWRLMLLSGFLFVGWLLRGSQSRVFVALLSALMGFVVGRLEHFPWSILQAATPWSSMRLQLGFPSAIALGLYSAAATLGLLIFSFRLFRIRTGMAKRVGIIAIWAMLFLTSMQWLIASKSRGVWLSFAIVVIVLAATNIRALTNVRRRQAIAILALVSVGATTLGYLNYDAVRSRILEEKQNTTKIFAGRFGEIDGIDEEGRINSIGTRYHLLLFGLEHWQENPVFGLGPGITKPLIKEQWTVEKKFHHLHNVYMEILLRFGILGLVLVVLIMVLIVKGSWQAYREQRIARDLFVFLVAALALSLLLGFSNFRMLDTDSRYYWYLIGGAMFGCGLPATRSRKRAATGREQGCL